MIKAQDRGYIVWTPMEEMALCETETYQGTH